MFGSDYDTPDIDVHGGLTYSDDHAPTYLPNGMWWFGFDTAHYGDLSPGMEWRIKQNILRTGGAYEPLWGGEYRNISYLRMQTIGLARQLWMLR